MTPTSLTHDQKLQALAYRFYQGAKWEPKAGDYYTTSRADLELYQVVDVRDGKVFTRYLVGSDVIAEWNADDFLAEHTFGRCRVFVPPWVLAASPAPADTEIWREALEEAAKVAEGKYDLRHSHHAHFAARNIATAIRNLISNPAREGE